MRRITIFIMAISLSTIAFAQEIKSKSIDTVSVTEIEIGEKLIWYQSSPDGKKIYVKGLDLLEELESKSSAISKIPEKAGKSVTEISTRITNRPTRRPRRYFHGNWAGLEFGINGYALPDRTLELEGENTWLSLIDDRSFNFNINFFQIDIGVTRRIGFVSGAGLHFSNYRFSGNNSIGPIEGDIIGPLYPADGIEYEKTKLVTKYLTMPLLLEIQIPSSSWRYVNLAFGPIGAVRVGSHTKVVYYDGGKKKVKERSEFYTNRFRYGLTARAGLGNIQLYGTWYETPLFKDDKGPKLHPYEVGISFSIF